MKNYIYMVLDVVLFIIIISFENFFVKIGALILAIIVSLLWKKLRLKDNERGEVK